MLTSTALASFTSPDILNFHPPIGNAGSYSLTLQISDGVNTPSFILNYQVTAASTSNSPPTFVSTPVAQTTPAGTPVTYTLPGTTDAESDSVTISMVSGGPSFVTFSSPNILNINPSLSNIGAFSI